MPQRGGKPTKFTPQNKAAVIARLEIGQALKEAAEGSKLKIATVQGWIARGKREGEGDYWDFAEAVERAKAGQNVEPMTEEEHRQKVSEVARKGNVQALKLYWEMISADREPDEAQTEETEPLAAVDELTQRRAARA